VQYCSRLQNDAGGIVALEENGSASMTKDTGTPSLAPYVAEHGLQGDRDFRTNPTCFARMP
jgi:hypothetical protein